MAPGLTQGPNDSADTYRVKCGRSLDPPGADGTPLDSLRDNPALTGTRAGGADLLVVAQS